MASSGASVKEIRKETGLSGQAARKVHSNHSPTSSSSGSGSFSRPNDQGLPGNTAPKTTSMPAQPPVATGNAPAIGIKAAIRAAEEGGISKKELKDIAGKDDPAKVIKRIDAMNQNGRDVRLNSGAANMLIKQAEKTPAYSQPNFGTGKIGRALQEMIGTPATPGAMIQGQRVGGTAGTPGTGLMIGGTEIRKGGRVAVRGFGGNKPEMEVTAAETSGPGPIANGGSASTTTGSVTPETTIPQEETILGPGMLSGGGAGFGGATFLGRPKSRFRKLGLNNKGMNALQRIFINYQNSLNS